MAVRLPLHVSKLTSRVRRYSEPVVQSPVSQGQSHLRVSTPEPALPTLLTSAPAKFAAYEVPKEQCWPAPKAKEAWAATKPSPRPSTVAFVSAKKKLIPVPSAVIAKEERCSRCTRQEMWAVYDVFRSMDQRGLHKIGRLDFLQTLNNYPTMDKLKVLKRSKLEARFRENAKEVTLQEFLQLMWPQATEEDMHKMLHWAKLRDAQEVVRGGNYVGEVDGLREVFALLDKDADEKLDVNELKGILKKNEIEQMMRETESHRAQFNADQPLTKETMSATSKNFKKLFRRGKSTHSNVEKLIQDENELKNKLTFAEFCCLVQPRHKAVSPTKHQSHH